VRLGTDVRLIFAWWQTKNGEEGIHSGDSIHLGIAQPPQDLPCVPAVKKSIIQDPGFLEGIGENRFRPLELFLHFEEPAKGKGGQFLYKALAVPVF
jgi:hypothetical protein